MPNDSPHSIQRSFFIGDRWLYYKIYTGYKTADRILLEVIEPLCNKLIKDKAIDNWFFIRYADPDFHLRVRFSLSAVGALNTIAASLFPSLKTFYEQSLIWKIQVDTYQREIERYGVHTMELSEEVFYRDSQSVIRFLKHLQEDEEHRWLFGIRSIDHLLEIFDYSLEQKFALLENLKTGFGNEFGMSRPLKKQLDAKFRTHRNSIQSYMNSLQRNGETMVLVEQCLQQKEQDLRPVAKKMINTLSTCQETLTLDQLMESHIHMLMNRLFKSKNRLNEMVCYDFLYRHYRSAIAMKAAQSKNVIAKSNVQIN